MLPLAIERMTDSFTCATDGRLKLFRHRTGDWIIDLEADPLEESADRVDSVIEERFGSRLESLRAALDRARRARTAECLRNDRAPVGRPHCGRRGDGGTRGTDAVTRLPLRHPGLSCVDHARER